MISSPIRLNRHAPSLHGKRVVTLAGGPSLSGPTTLKLPDGSIEVLKSAAAFTAPQMALLTASIKLGGALVSGANSKIKEIIGQVTTYVIQNVEPKKAEQTLYGLTTRKAALYSAATKDLSGKVFGYATAGNTTWGIVQQELSKAGVDAYEKARVAQAIYTRFHSPKANEWKNKADKMLDKGLYDGWLVQKAKAVVSDTAAVVEDNKALLIGGAAALLLLYMASRKGGSKDS